jgi:hypothetical protein
LPKKQIVAFLRPWRRIRCSKIHTVSPHTEKKEESCQRYSAQQIKQINSQILQCIWNFDSDGIRLIIVHTNFDALYSALMLGSNKSWAVRRAYLIGATKIVQQLENFIIYYENKHGLRK